MNHKLSKALDETVKEIQGYSKEELKSKLDRHKESNLAKTVNGLLTFQLIDAMDTEVFTMPTGLGIEGMRKFIKECAKK